MWGSEMSGIGGILNFNERPLDLGEFVCLWDLLKSRGPDGGDIATADAGGLCYQAFHINRESRMERQPLVSREGRIMVAELRLDNREELIPELRSLVERANGGVTDIALAMAAYEKWGELFASHLVGEYAIAMLSPSERAMLLVRDHIGSRPLFYTYDKDRLICSSTIPSLLDASSIAMRVDENFIAGFLGHGPEPGLTAFKHIHAVKPGHVVRARSDGRVTEQRYWGLDPDKEISYPKDSDYEEVFFELFRKAVSGSLRSDRRVMADLSGGLDSSSVVCMADHLMANGTVQAPDLETISHVYDEATTCDERRFISYVEEQRGVKGHHLREDDYQILSPLVPEPSIGGPDAFYIFAAYHRAKAETMQSQGARLVIGGRGGDQIFNSIPDPTGELGDLLVLGKLLKLDRRLRVWSASLKKPYVGLLFESMVVALLPRRFGRILRPGPEGPVPAWVDKGFARRTNMRQRRWPPSDVFGFRLPSGRDQSTGFLSVMYGVNVSHDQAKGNIRVSYPLLYRPLVEFMQAIPFSQKVRPEQTRSLLRRSLRNLLPPQTAKRKSKKNPSEAIFRAVRREWPRLSPLFIEPRLCSYGFARREPLLAEFERARQGLDTRSIDVLRTIGLELWLRVLENHRPVPDGRDKAVSIRGRETRAGGNG